MWYVAHLVDSKLPCFRKKDACCPRKPDTEPRGWPTEHGESSAQKCAWDSPSPLLFVWQGLAVETGVSPVTRRTAQTSVNTWKNSHNAFVLAYSAGPYPGFCGVGASLGVLFPNRRCKSNHFFPKTSKMSLFVTISLRLIRLSGVPNSLSISITWMGVKVWLYLL